MYGVRFIDDDELPKDHDFVMIRTPDDVMLFVKASKVTPCVLEQAWAAYRALPNIPQQREPELPLATDVGLQRRESLAPAG